jgi:hypothetical protein
MLLILPSSNPILAIQFYPISFVTAKVLWRITTFVLIFFLRSKGPTMNRTLPENQRRFCRYWLRLRKPGSTAREIPAELKSQTMTDAYQE